MNDEARMTKKPDARILIHSRFVTADSFVIRHSDFLRHSSFGLRHLVTGRILLAVTLGFLAISFLRAQEMSPSPSLSATPARSVRISFVPPPLEGKISLGVYNESGQLVRVLHQEAEFDEFTIGADALSTKWDGKDDYDYDLPAGKYSARGFLVAPMKIGTIAETNMTSGVPPGANSIRIRLAANPLENNERPTVDISAGFDDDDVYLQTVDGLPLVTVAKRLDAKTASLAAGRDNKSVIVFLSNGVNDRQVEVSGITKMMGFDCGKFELK
jgi:hypothetical protein